MMFHLQSSQIWFICAVVVCGCDAAQLQHPGYISKTSVSLHTIIHPNESLRWDGPPFHNRIGYGPGRWLQGFLDTPLDHDDIDCIPNTHTSYDNERTTRMHAAPETGQGPESLTTTQNQNPTENNQHKTMDSPNGAPIDTRCPILSLPILARLADVQPAPLGPLLIHCGGPCSGKECIYGLINGTIIFYGAPSMDPELLKNYDIIGIDQRGVMEAKPNLKSSVCFPSDLSNTTQILTAMENRTAIQQLLYDDPKYQYGNGKNFLDYISTRDLAMDLNHLRKSIGARSLSIMGFSYGTLVGATYATMYPHNTGRALFLGPVLSTVDASAFSEGTAQAYEGVLTHVFELCDKQKGCPAGPDSRKKFMKVINGIKQGTYMDTDGKLLMETVFYNYVKEKIRTSVTYYHLLCIISDLHKREQAAIDEVVAYRPVDERGLWCDHGEVGAISNIRGSDYVSRPGPSEMLGEINRRATLYPLGGQFEAFWYQLVLSGSLSMPRPVRLGNPTVTALVVGNLYDSVTSYRGSASLSSAFPSGQLITFQGDGHCMAEATVGYAREEASKCQVILNNYLLRGNIDASITLCPVRLEPSTTAEYTPWTWDDVEAHSVH